MNVLVISEKDIAARRIAAILSGGRDKRHKLAGVNTYEFSRGGDRYTVVGLRGHIVTVDYPKRLNHWFKVKPRDLIWEEPEKRVDRSASKIGSALRTLAREHERVIVATDYDREGELIGTEALDLVKRANRGIDVRRARFSALTKDEVTRAFDSLTGIDEDLAASAEARQVVDLAWGATLTRFISLASRQVGKDFLSVGRVQSPTLALIVEREKEIRAFEPTPYWEVHAACAKGGDAFDAEHAEGRFWDKEAARRAHARAATARTAAVTGVARSERTERPPSPFNTTSFLRAATSLGMGAKRALSVAEDLYTSGFISYPRTDNTVYPKSLDLKEIVQKLAAKGAFRDDARRVLEQTNWRPTRGKKTSTDHPPIHPVEVARGSQLKGQQWKVYELVVRRFLATLMPPATTESLKVRLDVAGEPFQAKGYRITKPGYRAVYPYKKSNETVLPPMREGDAVDVRGVELQDKETKPPSRYGQGSLIQEMENRGLGTKSTRAEILNKLYSRNYVRGDPPEPTETGIAVVEALEQHADLITKPEMTARLESEMEEIAEGERSLDAVVKDSRTMLDHVFDQLEAKRRQIGSTIKGAIQDQNTLGACPECGEGLVPRKSRKGKRFVGCTGYPDCKQTYPLPQYGKIVPDGDACFVCKAPVIKVISKGKRPWVTCLTMGCEGTKGGKGGARAPSARGR